MPTLRQIEDHAIKQAILIGELREALRNLYGQVDQAREGFGIYNKSKSMDAAMKEAARLLMTEQR